MDKIQQDIPKRDHTVSQQAHKKMLNILIIGENLD